MQKRVILATWKLGSFSLYPPPPQISENHLNIQNLEFVVLETICHQILPTASSSGGHFNWKLTFFQKGLKYINFEFWRQILKYSLYWIFIRAFEDITEIVFQRDVDRAFDMLKKSLLELFLLDFVLLTLRRCYLAYTDSWRKKAITW